MQLQLNPNHFVSPGHEKDLGDYSAEDRVLFDAIRKSCPHLREWGDLPIGVAWCSYCQDVHLISWLEKYKQEDRARFLAYIHWHEVNGEFPWGSSADELDDLAGKIDFDQVRN